MAVWVAVPLVLGVVAGVIVAFGGLTAAAVVALGLITVSIAVFAPGVLYAMYLLIPFYKGAAQAYSPVDITLVLALLNTLQVVAVVVDRPPSHISRPGITLWVALGILVLGGVLYAPDQALALSHAVSFWLLVFVPLVVGALRVSADPRYGRQLLWTFFGMGVLMTVVGVPLISSSDRLVALGTNTINVALAALLVPLLGVAFVVRQGGLHTRLAVIVLIPPAVIVALASGSRGPILVLFTVAMIGVARYLAHPSSVDWPRTAAVAGVALAGILVVSSASPYLPALSTGRFALFGSFIETALTGDSGDASATDTSSATRVQLYGAAVSMLEERPILGTGTAGFEAMSDRLLAYHAAYPHDALLQFAAEFGFVGIALFVGLIVAGLVRRLPGLGQPLKVAFLYFLLQSMLSGDIFADRITWGLLLLLLLMDAASPTRLATGGSRSHKETSDLATQGLVA